MQFELSENLSEIVGNTRELILVLISCNNAIKLLSEKLLYY